LYAHRCIKTHALYEAIWINQHTHLPTLTHHHRSFHEVDFWSSSSETGGTRSDQREHVGKSIGPGGDGNEDGGGSAGGAGDDGRDGDGGGD